MSESPVPFNEPWRLQTLREFGILDSKPEPEFDRLTALVARHFAAPICLVSLVDHDRQWFKSRHGLEVCETPRDVAFCSFSILQDSPTVVHDAAQDPRFAHNSLVTSEPHIRFYAGAPLIAAPGIRLGTLCIIDTVPRPDFTPQEEEDLAQFADLALLRMQQRRDRVAAETATERLGHPLDGALAELAHEVRSPIGAIVNLGELLQNGTIADARPFIGEIVNTGRHLLAVAERTLEAARLRAGEVKLVEQTFPLADLSTHLRLMVGAQAARRGVGFEDQLAQSAARLRADATRVLQMLTNLAGNAVKYTPPGGRVRLAAEVTRSGALDLIVDDTGSGMTPEELAVALRPFGRPDRRPHDADDHGAGLGLALTRRLIELHGGRLALESAPGSGTRAVLRFPAWRVAA